MKRRSAFVEEQRKRFAHSCLSCLRGEHDCTGYWDVNRYSNEIIPCSCGCVIEPWPWPTGDESPISAG